MKPVCEKWIEKERKTDFVVLKTIQLTYFVV